MPATLTDCARIFVLLGEPNDVKKDQSGETVGPRAPETWTLKDRPGFKFPGGQIQVPFDESCRLPAGSRFGEQLGRPAEARVVSPNIGYRMTADHHHSVNGLRDFTRDKGGRFGDAPLTRPALRVARHEA